MTVKIGISGFGRIGRCTFRTSLTHPDVEVAAVNSRTIGPIMADLLKFDTVHGTWDHDVSFDSENPALIIDAEHGAGSLNKLIMRSCILKQIN